MYCCTILKVVRVSARKHSISLDFAILWSPSCKWAWWMVMDVYIYSNCRHTGTVQSISNLHSSVELLHRLGNTQICTRQSAVIWEASTDASWRVHIIAEKDLWIKWRKLDWPVFWESLGIFLSATTISNLWNDGLLCDYNWRLCKSIVLWVGSR